jgi:hypothetical protein
LTVVVARNYNIIGKGRDMEEKRKNERKKVDITTVIRKMKTKGRYAIMEFKAKDLSLGGVFILTEDLNIFDLGEQLEILVDTGGKVYYEGAAIVVRSARVFTDDDIQLESGFGLMFINPNKEFTEQLLKKLHA